MKKKILVGILLGVMLVSMVGCKKESKVGTEDSSVNKPVETQENNDVTKAPEVSQKETYEYVNSVFGYSFMMPKYSSINDDGTTFWQINYVKDMYVGNLAEKYVGVLHFTDSYTENGVDIYKVNSVYDIHDNMGRESQRFFIGATPYREIVALDVKVAEKAETINGYEMLPYEGTMEIKGVLENYTYGVYGYYIFANGLPIMVSGVDCSSIINGAEYPSELSLMDSICEDVDAMVKTFNGDNMKNLGLIRE